MNKKGMLLILVVIAVSNNLCAKTAAENIIHFKLDKDKIILPVTINNSKILNVILDSGMPWEGVYLFNKKFNNELKLKNPMNAQVGGAGDGEASTAIMYESVKIKIDKKIFDKQTVVISQSEGTQYFSTDGVIGRTILKSPVAKIDFDSFTVTLMDTMPKLDSSWIPVDVRLNDNNIPFLTAKVAVNDSDSLVDVSVYIDISGSEPLELLVKPVVKFSIPQVKDTLILGTGLSGDIKGVKSKVAKFYIAGCQFNNVPANFPDAKTRSKQKDNADGIIGCGLMKRFNIYLDYPENKIYLKPNKNFNSAW